MLGFVPAQANVRLGAVLHKNQIGYTSTGWLKTEPVQTRPVGLSVNFRVTRTRTGTRVCVNACHRYYWISRFSAPVHSDSYSYSCMCVRALTLSWILSWTLAGWTPHYTDHRPIHHELSRDLLWDRDLYFVRGSCVVLLKFMVEMSDENLHPYIFWGKMACYTVCFTLDNGTRREALLTVISVGQFRPTCTDPVCSDRTVK